MIHRLMKILKWTAIGVGVLAVLILVINAWFVWTTGRRLESKLAEIRAAGDSTSIAALVRPSIPRERNAATYLHEAAPEAAAIYEKLHAREECKDFLFNPTYPVPERVHRALVEVFKAHPNVLPLLQKAATCPDYQPRLDYQADFKQFCEQLTTAVGEFRDCARVLCYWSWLKVAEGKRDEAIRNALLIGALADHLDRNPLLMHHLVANILRGIAFDAANYAVQTGPVSEEVRAALIAELVRSEEVDSWSRALKNDRAAALAFNFEQFDFWPDRDTWLVGRPLWHWRCLDYLDAFEAAVPLVESDRSYREDLSRREATAASLGLFGREIFVPLVNCRLVSLSLRARIRSLRVVLALQTRGGSQVPKLNELGLPAKATQDPYTGEPLHVKRLPEGWLVYAVGEDFADDGGKLDGSLPNDVGVGPPLPAKPR